MKVLILVPDLNKPGGVANYFLAIGDTFFDYKSKVEYFIRGSRKGTRPYMVPVVMILDYIGFLLKVTFNKYDVIHVNTSIGKRNFVRDPFFVFVAKLLGNKVLLFIHGWDKEHETFGTAMKIFLKSDAIIVLAHEFKDKIRSYGFRRKILVESTVVNKEFVNAFSIESIKSRPDRDTKIVLFLSRIERDKGVYQAIDAVEIASKLCQDIHLIIAGSGIELNRVRDYIESKNLKNVDLVGYLTGKSKIEVFYKSDIFLFPTFYGEGMPINVLEAMMAGLPVITRPVGGIKDFFINEKMGYTTESLAPRVFANLLCKVILNDNLSKQISDYNYRFAKNRFTPDSIVKRLVQIYSELV